MKPWMQWTIGVALVAAAWGVAAITPVEERREAPFDVVVEVGEPGVGRNIAVTVTEVRRAETATAGGWTMEGNWVVVDFDVAAVQSEAGVSLRKVNLVLDGVTYSASERPKSLLDAGLHAGILRGGSVAFELPPDLETGSGALRFSLRNDDRLDSAIVVPIDLAGLPSVAEAELLPSGWSAP